MVDVGLGAYPRLNNTLLKEVGEKFKVRMTTLEIGFNLQDAITEFTKYYETINIQKLDDAFRFPNADAVVEYFKANGKGVWDPEPDDKKWKEMQEYVRSVAQKEIEANGVWLEPKPYYVVTAENPAKTVLPYVTYAHQYGRSRFEGQS